MSDDGERVVLVDGSDVETGTAGKMEAHRDGGRLHRAFSILVFDREGRTLLQQRAAGKYHAPGLWSNTCCSHPRPGERLADAAHRKLVQELGFDCPLTEAFAFTYSVDVGNGMTEREFDHVFFGEFAGTVRPNSDEVADFRWVPLPELYRDARPDSPRYTAWFKILLVELAHSGARLPKFVPALGARA